MAPKVVTLPIASIAIADTMPDLVSRVQTVVDYLNQGPSGGPADTANNALHLVGKHESELNVNSATKAGWLKGYADGASPPPTIGSLIVGDDVGSGNSWQILAIGSDTQVLTVNASGRAEWKAPSGGPGGSHNFLSSTHSDTTAAGATRGDLIAAQGASPLWTRLAVGTANQVLVSNGTEPGWASTVNAAGFLAGNTVTTNSTGLYFATSSELVSVANLSIRATRIMMGITANNDVFDALAAGGLWLKSPGTVGAGIGFQPMTDGLDVTKMWLSNTGVLTLYANQGVGNTTNVVINTSAIVFGGGNTLNALAWSGQANTALVANNATYAFGKSEINLNVNSAVTANDSSYLNGNAASNFVLLAANNHFTGANNYFDGNVYTFHLGANTAPHANAVARFGGQYGALLNAAGNLGATPTFDFNVTNEFYGTMTANATFTFSNPIDGHRYCLLINSGAGGFYIAWPGTCKWGAGGQPLNSQSAGLIDMFTFIYVAATGNYYMSYATGF
jgi:hypothetical protein